MRKFVIGLAAIAAIGVAVPASAEVVIRGGDSGVSVGIGEPHHRHHRHWYHDRAECRVVKERVVLPNGNVIIKTRRSC